MKKIYQSPVVMIVAMKGNCHLLSGSAKGTSVMSGSASKEYETLSRRGGSFWDDDDDE